MNGSLGPAIGRAARLPTPPDSDSRRILDDVAMMCLRLRTTGVVQWADESAQRLLRSAGTTLTAGVNLTDLVDPEERPGVEAALAHAVEHGYAERVARLAGTAERGRARFVHLVMSRHDAADPSADGLHPAIAVQGWDVTSSVLRRHELEDRTSRDPLTGYPNLATFTDRLSLEIACSRPTDMNVTILLADVDDYHTVTDTRGRATGNQLLVDVGRRLGASLRLKDSLARTGESEFGIICPDLPGMHSAIALAERLCTAVAKPMMVGNHVQSATISVGIESADGRHDSATTMLQHATQALSDHKQLRHVLQRDRPG